MFKLVVEASEAQHEPRASLYHATGSSSDATHIKVTCKLDKTTLLNHASCVCWHGAPNTLDAFTAPG